jgi:hypothetical protein
MLCQSTYAPNESQDDVPGWDELQNDIPYRINGPVNW